mgnify:CR=1 FL=1
MGHLQRRERKYAIIVEWCSNENAQTRGTIVPLQTCRCPTLSLFTTVSAIFYISQISFRLKGRRSKFDGGDSKVGFETRIPTSTVDKK